MKVLQVLPTLSAGGAEGFVTNLGVSLAALGCEVRFYLLAGVRGERGRVLQERLQAAGVEVLGAEDRNIRSPGNVLRLAGILRRWRPDIVQSNLYSAELASVMARTLSLPWRTRFVRRLAITDIVGHRNPLVVKALGHCFSQTIACSPAVRDAYVEWMGPGAAERCLTIPNGGLLRQSVPGPGEKREARSALGLTPDALLVGHIGRMWGKGPGTGLDKGSKAQDILLKAFARAFRGRPDRMLALVGDGPLRPEAEALADALGIGEQTRFLGELPEPWLLLTAADIFCFPSRHEGLPNVLPEAASCGLPVVASNIPEIRDIAPGEAWQLHPVDDVEAFAHGLRQVAEQMDQFAALAAEAAPDIRKRFSMQTCAERYLEVYRMNLKMNRLD